MGAPDVSTISNQEEEGKNLFSSGYTVLTIHPKGKARPNMNRGGGNAIIYVLPLPKGMNDSYDNEWAPVELGAVGEGFKNLAMTALQKGIGNISLDDLKGAGEKIAGGTIKGALDTVGLYDKVSAVSGLYVNPYTQLTYKSPTLRQFQFNWNIVPVSAKAAGLVEKMVTDIRQYVYPEISQLGFGLFDFPAEFEVTVKTKSGKKLLQTAPCACTNFMVNYDTEGNPYIHKDGQPVTTVVTISLQEVFLLDRASITDLYK